MTSVGGGKLSKRKLLGADEDGEGEGDHPAASNVVEQFDEWKYISMRAVIRLKGEGRGDADVREEKEWTG